MMRLQAKTITLRADTWLQKNVPLIIESDLYRQGGALFITRDEGEDSGAFSDGPIGIFLLSPFAKGGGKRAYSNSMPYDHGSTLKTLQEIFKVSPLWAVPRIPETIDLRDLHKQ